MTTPIIIFFACYFTLTLAAFAFLWLRASRNDRDYETAYYGLEAAVLFSMRLTADDARQFLLDWLERDEAETDKRWDGWPAFREAHVLRSLGSA